MSRLARCLSRTSSQPGYPNPQFDICCHLVPVRCPYIAYDITTTLYYAPVDGQKPTEYRGDVNNNATTSRRHAGTQLDC